MFCFFFSYFSFDKQFFRYFSETKRRDLRTKNDCTNVSRSLLHLTFGRAPIYENCFGSFRFRASFGFVRHESTTTNEREHALQESKRKCRAGRLREWVKRALGKHGLPTTVAKNLKYAHRINRQTEYVIKVRIYRRVEASQLFFFCFLNN